MMTAVKTAVSMRPGPVCNEDLLELSDEYAQKLVEAKKEVESHEQVQETSINAIRE